MIVPMKKVAVIIQQKDAGSCVSKLRSLGVFHVEHERLPQGKALNALQEDLSVVTAALSILSEKELGNNKAALRGEKLPDWKFTLKHIIDLRKRLEHLEDFSHTLINQINQWQQWGDFEPAAIEALANKNIYIRLYQIPLKELRQLPETVVVKKIFIAAGIAHCAVISFGALDIPFKEVGLPKTGLKGLRARFAQDEHTIQSLRDELHKLICYRQEFIAVKKSLEAELEFQQAISGMGQSANLAYVVGYVPYNIVGKVTDLAKREKLGYYISEPSQDDNVPVLLRNPKWVSIISPIFKFLEILPEYREWDISPVFIVFFSLFFGMLIGDAGYGIVYMLLTSWAHKKIGNKLKEKSIFSLFYLLSLCAIIWGLLTGTFFGQAWFLKIGYKPLVPALNNPKGIQTFCFFVGALHLSIAHIWRAIIKLPSAAAFSDVGWVCVVWSVFLLAKMLLLGGGFPSFGMWLIAMGVSLVIIFNNPQKNPLKILNVDLITLALGLISSFGEVVSYIRLFAVGMAGVAIADAFNAIAADIGVGSIAALLGSVFVVMLGHSLCLLLGPLSVLVHGIRLNLLEFSGHANVSWSGIAYKPLKE